MPGFALVGSLALMFRAASSLVLFLNFIAAREEQRSYFNGL